MTADQTSHITVTQKHRGSEIRKTYAISKDLLQQAQLWAAKTVPSPTNKDLTCWLLDHGCLLDSFDDRPAIVARYADGSSDEQYFRSGKWHREEGPAIVRLEADGSSVEEYYRDGKRYRENGPTIVTRLGDGSKRAAIRHSRRDGPRPAPKAPNTPGTTGPA